MKTLEGNLVSKGIKIGIVAARFNEFITSKLLGGARDGLLRHNVQEEDIHVAWVPGAFEIPLVAAKMASTTRSSAWARSSVGQPATTTMCAARCPRASPMSPWTAACRCSLGC